MGMYLYFVLFVVLLLGCSREPKQDADRIIESFDSIARTPVEEGYVPDRRIDFSHVVHSVPGKDMDCRSCHTTPGEKVESSLCTSCHRIQMPKDRNLEYYEQLKVLTKQIRELEQEDEVQNESPS